MVNAVDVAVFLGYLAVQGFRAELVTGVVYRFVAALSVAAGPLGYRAAGDLRREQLGLPSLTAHVAAFAGLSALTLAVVGLAMLPVSRGASWRFDRLRILRAVDGVVGIAPPLLAGATLLSAALLLPVTLPIRPDLRASIEQSWWGRTVLTQVANFAPRAEDVLLRLPGYRLLDLASAQRASQSVGMELPLPAGLSLPVAEGHAWRLLELVNAERIKAGVAPLVMDDALREVARAHSRDRFERRYFSH